jgi:hypothetical protein
LRHLGFSEDEIAQFVATYLEGVPVLRQAGIGVAWCKVVVGWHQPCCFSLAGSSRRGFPHAGTRPGDPLAEVIFSFAFESFLQQLRASLSAAGLVISALLVWWHRRRLGRFATGSCGAAGTH